jgi:hypothetical protein
MIALASVLASPLCVPRRGVRGARPRLFLIKEATQKRSLPTLPRPAADCLCRSQPSQHRHGDNLGSALKNNSYSISV